MNANSIGRTFLLVVGSIVVAAVSLAGCPGEPPPIPIPPPAVFTPPLNDAKAGEELRLRRGDTDWVYRVVSTDDENVEIEYQTYEHGEPAGPARRDVWGRNSMGIPKEYIIRQIVRDRIDVAGRSWDCWRVYAASRQEMRLYWLCDEVPVHGILRLAADKSGKANPDLRQAIDYVPPR